MFRKLFLIGLGAAGALFVVNSVWSGSVSTCFKRARACVERQISPEFEIERIRNQIAKLTPDMNRHIEKIAEATVECASLNRKIDLVSAELEKRQKDMLAVTEKVERGIIPVGYTTTNMKDKLARDLKSYKTCERDLANKQKLLDAKQKALEAARTQLRTIQSARQELEVEVARLEAELAQVRAEASASKIVLDDSRLGKIKGSIERLRETIEKEKQVVELTGQFGGDPTVEVKTDSNKDVTTEIRELFGVKKATEHAVAD